MHKAAVAAALMISVACLAAGDQPADNGPTNPAAKSALLKLSMIKAEARKQHDATVKNATAQAITELQETKAAVMRQGNDRALEEANRIQAAIDALESDTSSASIGPASAAELRKRLAGTTWGWGGTTERITFKRDGTVSNEGWDTRGLITTWDAVDTRTVVLTVRRGRSQDLYAILSFDEKAETYRGLGFEGGKALGVSRPAR